ncbi:hypothetical protein OG455_14325 [Kitasatospora sp. NBC_01287]|uniref:hypothetical protein n=1 Tax=Kitasatospora sp. NBC_01287 TaxID=2903573 RepID=UPI00224D21DE|nr:hypothetical protein [Kitasatospora sp. NBC_01287]MCX4746680.1 hypothetical protein [Kitasatospora sp. NBC_01287]
MTNHQPTTPTPPPHVPPHPVSDRLFPECECPANCGGRPEALRRLAQAYPTPTEVGAKPPANPYAPTTRGELVHDSLNRRTGAFMGRLGSLVYLRPPGGGFEWDVDQRWLQRPPATGAAS